MLFSLISLAFYACFLVSCARFLITLQEKQLEQADLELQLKVWKELAVTKQVLMQAATKTLGLKAECSTEELETALKSTINRAKELEANLQTAQENSNKEIQSLNRQLAESQKKVSDEQAAKEEAISANESSIKRIDEAKVSSVEEVRKLKAQIADKQKEIKQITKVLADTPENVVKKLKALKKEKMDEANDRKRAEETSRRLRKERQTAEQKLEESNLALKNAGELVEKYRDLQKFANEQFDQLISAADDKNSIDKVPLIDDALLDSIEKAAESVKDDK